MGEKETVYVVVDHGEREEMATVRGVFHNKDAAEEHKEEIEHPHSWMRVTPSHLQ